MPFAPLGKGFLTGTVSAEQTFRADDFRSKQPRFTAENRQAKQVFVDAINGMAAKKTATAAQIALAWLLAQRPWIVPIPGTTKLHRVEENIAATEIMLDDDDLRSIEEALSGVVMAGDRYPPHNKAMAGR